MSRTLIALALALTACPTPSEPSPGEGAADMTTNPDGLVDEAKTDKVEVPVEDPGMKMGDHASGEVSNAFQALEGASVSFGEPADGASLTSPVKVTFNVDGAVVKPAGTLEAGTGHHHLIINGEPTAAGTVVPADDTHIHYGKGQTEAEVELPPGEHTLTLQFADGAHRSYGPDVSQTIKVTVTE